MGALRLRDLKGNYLRTAPAGTRTTPPLIEKLGLWIDPDGVMFLPEGTAASTNIVKPENASADFLFCPANELFSMRLADELKVPVPQVSLRHPLGCTGLRGESRTAFGTRSFVAHECRLAGCHFQGHW